MRGFEGEHAGRADKAIVESLGEDDMDEQLTQPGGIVEELQEPEAQEPFRDGQELLDTRAAGQQIVARVEPAVRTQPHEKIRLTFVPDRIHFFDAKTEAVIN